MSVPADREAGSLARARGPMLVLLGVAVVVLALCWSAGSAWSLIGVGVHGEVTSSEWAEEGPSFRVLVIDDHRVLTVDRAIVEDLGGSNASVGQHLSKDRGQRTLVADGGAVPLRRSPTSWRAMAMLATLLAFALVRRRTRWG